VIAPSAAPAWAAPPVAPDEAEILRALRVFVVPGDVAELRALGVTSPDYRRPHIVSGYYDDLEVMARDAAAVAPRAKGAYFTLNPVDHALLARSYNRCRPVDHEALTSDPNIVRRRWLPVDLDPVRPAEVSASEEEHAAALERARTIFRFLRAEGWPDPVIADSGNGAHLVYPIDLPRDDGGRVERVLKTLAFRFDDERVAVDTTTHNPARIWKLYGTPARKGDSILDRPHRLARLLHIPEGLR
jgi:hypothetical protein